MTARTDVVPPAPLPGIGQGPAVFALVLGAAAMGLSPTLVRLCDVGPLTSAFWRTALALPLLYGWMRVAERKAAHPPARLVLSAPVVYSGLLFAADLVFWHLAIVRTSIANATFFATLAPIWVVVFGWLFWRERVSRAVLLGLGLCLIGGAALVAQSVHAAPGHVVGDAFAIATGLWFGLYFLTIRSARRTLSAARVTFEMTIVAAAILAVVALALEHRFMPQSVAGWELLGTLAVVSHTGGQGLLSIALGALPAVFSSLVIFLEAIIAALIAWGVLGEAVTLAQAGGAVLIIGGIIVARPRPQHG